jgi:effector-binding domain-containing protein
MKALKILLYVVVGLVVLFLLMGLFAKKDYRIERSTMIYAPRDTVFEQVRYFKNFHAWSPWSKIDDNMQWSVEGADGEVGAVYRWKGNDDVGEGAQTLKSVSPERIDIELAFKEPWENTVPTWFELLEKGDSTKITWIFDMKIPFPWNGLAMLTDVNSFVGKDFERGLGNLKKLCENLAHKKYRGYEVLIEKVPESYFLGVRGTVAFDSMKLFFDSAFALVNGGIPANKLTVAGPPTNLYWMWDTLSKTTDMAVAMPVSAAVKKPVGGVVSYTLPAADSALVINFYGKYDSIGNAHYAMDDYMREKKLVNVPPVIETYITDPTKEPDTLKWLTRLIYFVKPASDTIPPAPKSLQK